MIAGSAAEGEKGKWNEYFPYTLQAIQVWRTCPPRQHSSLEPAILQRWRTKTLFHRGADAWCVYIGGRWVRVRGFPIIEESHFQGNGGKTLTHAVKPAGCVTNQNPPLWTPLNISLWNLDPFFIVDDIIGCSYGDLQEASFTERLTHREGPRTNGHQRWVYLVVVFVTLATRSEGARSVCTAHSCVTWRGWGGRWVLMSTTSHKLLLLQPVAERRQRNSLCSNVEV